MENSTERIEAAASIIRALLTITPNSEALSEANYRIRLQRSLGEPYQVGMEIWRGNSQFNWQSGTWDFPEAFSDGKPLQ